MFGKNKKLERIPVKFTRGTFLFIGARDCFAIQIFEIEDSANTIKKLKSQ